jgi:adenylate cyclase
MDYDKLETFVFNKLKEEINPNYFYHNLKHTVDAVESAIRIAQFEQLSQDDTILLKTATALHDVGYIYQYDDNEAISVKFAHDVLPRFGYGDKAIQYISKLILATDHALNPDTYLEMLICDADLDYLGRDDYFDKSMLLFKEWRISRCKMNLKEWYELQVRFLESHEYFSKYSLTHREEKKLKILYEIKELLYLV